ncbi:MAG: Fe-S cluster assembly protein SufD [Ignavibacteria bacterium]|nr:Fe-S cluster assembly protein SufD [Ignavibacteria bacterium]
MKYTTEKNSWYLSAFEKFEQSLNGESASRLHTLRRSALERFNSLGFPTTRHEEWRFTNISPILKTNFRPVLNPTAEGLSRKDVGQFAFGTRHLLVFVNGFFSGDLSTLDELPGDAYCGSLATAVKSDHPVLRQHLAQYATYDDNAFSALNTAFLRDGAFIYVPDGIVMDDSVHLLFIAAGKDHALISPRNLIVVGKNSQVSIVESYVSLATSSYLTNVLTEIVVGDHSVIEHDKLQNERRDAFHIASIHALQGTQTNLISNSISIGGSLVRNNVTSVLDAEGSECTLNGLALATGTQLIDNHTTIDHAKPRCVSHELYKSILDGKSRGVFNGKIFVRKDAQKTDAKQTNKTLLLSEDATIDTKPQLEIFADDVKCTHGATVGQLDAEQIFYLRSRGIDDTTARDILTFAFASDVVSRVHVDPLREQLEALVHSRLDQGRTLQD